MKKNILNLLINTATISIASTIILGFILMIASDSLYKSDTYNEEFSHSFNIYALEDNTSYIMSRYSSESLERYHFMRKLNGGYKSGRIPSSSSYIYETTGQPKIEVYYKKVDQEWVNVVYKILAGDLESIYKIHVPENSIKYDFNIDLE